MKKMREKVSEDLIKAILRDKEEKLESIHEKMYQLYQALESSNPYRAFEHAPMIPAVRTDGMPGGRGSHRDLSDVVTDVFTAYENQIQESNTEIRKIMWELSEQEATINRVWACFFALDNPYYMILRSIYVEKQLYQTVEHSLDMSHKTFEKNRQRGIELIQRFYESGDSVADLMRREKSSVAVGRRGVKKRVKKSTYDQLTLQELLTAIPELQEENKC